MKRWDTTTGQRWNLVVWILLFVAAWLGSQSDIAKHVRFDGAFIGGAIIGACAVASLSFAFALRSKALASKSFALVSASNGVALAAFFTPLIALCSASSFYLGLFHFNLGTASGLWFAWMLTFSISTFAYAYGRRRDTSGGMEWENRDIAAWRFTFALVVFASTCTLAALVLKDSSLAASSGAWNRALLGYGVHAMVGLVGLSVLLAAFTSRLKEESDILFIAYACAVVFCGASSISGVGTTGFGLLTGLAGLGIATVVLLGILTHQADRRHDNLAARLFRLSSEAVTDGLTGVPNRRGFEKAMAAAIDSSKRGKKPLSVAILDIDKFKKYNDEFGHLKGDECLREVAGTIADSCIRPSDVLARYGGEEFVLILPNTDSEGARTAVERVRSVVEAHRIVHAKDAGQPYVTVSIGVCTAGPGISKDRETMMKLADEALYRAKENGRNRFEIAEAPTTEAARSHA